MLTYLPFATLSKYQLYHAFHLSNSTVLSDFFQLNYHQLFSLQMKQIALESVEQNSTSNSERTHKVQHANNKCGFKKNKSSESNSESDVHQATKIKLTKEQKFELQKIKNRESAQRSRDMKKLYVQQLQSENSKLKEENTHLTERLNKCMQNICPRCLQSVGNQKVQNMFGFQKFQEEEPLNNLNLHQDSLNDDQRYQRIISESHINKLQLFTFILVTILAVFSLQPQAEFNTTPQILVSSTLATLKNPISPVQSQSQLALTDSHSTCLLQYLSEMNIFHRQQMPPPRLKNMRAQIVKEYEATNDLLICRMPRIIRNNKSKALLSHEFEIILEGNQLFEEYAQPKTLYMVKAEVKQIMVYNNFECLTFKQEQKV